MRQISAGNNGAQRWRAFATAGNITEAVPTRIIQELCKMCKRITSARFTIDGSDALEAQLANICEQVAACVQSVIAVTKLEAIVLGGGYGRGEGGVLRMPRGDQPYNDIEFYVFLRGSRLWNQRKYLQPLV